jgi:hypothetical protein
VRSSQLALLLGGRVAILRGAVGVADVLAGLAVAPDHLRPGVAAGFQLVNQHGRIASSSAATAAWSVASAGALGVDAAPVGQWRGWSVARFFAGSYFFVSWSMIARM